MAQVKPHMESTHPALVVAQNQKEHITTATMEMWNGEVACMGKPDI